MPARRTLAQALPGSCFVSGMAAGDGEQLGALAVVLALRFLGLRVAAMTPLVADAVQQSGRWSSPRLECLGRASSFGVPPDVLSPYVLPPASSPSAAVQQAGARVEARAVVETYEVLSTWADAVVVAGVGGLDEPLGPALHVHEVAGRLALPLLLTLRADADAPRRARRALDLTRAHGVRLAGWVAMGDTPGNADMRSRVADVLGMAPLGVVPSDARASADAVAHLDLQALHRALGMRGGPSPDAVH
ncbi:ATP-dependent dethiobiotin synthetase BioD 1 [Variovorax sp. PBL-H6]|nr:ATP-dependent dethiobiotin synthetase BioD 1 [Variovorax sp. PBL-H6]